MTRKACCIVFLLFPFITSHAAIIDQGTVTVDTQTGLAWLDVTETANLSYDDVMFLTSEGESLEGWRHATVADFETLLDNLGLAYLHQDNCSNGPRNYCGGTADEFPVAPGLQEAIELLGDSLVNGYAIEGEDPPFLFDPNGAGYSYGYLGPPVSASNWNQGNGADFGLWIGAISDWQYFWLDGTPQDSTDFINSNFTVSPGGNSLNVGGQANPYVGHYLVRNVPIPPAVLLYVSALVGLRWLVKRRTH